MKPKLFRVTTVSESLKILLKGQHKFMSENGFEVIELNTINRNHNMKENFEHISITAKKKS